jgi:hypothetical protein
MKDSDDQPKTTSARADLISAFAWIGFGLAVVIGAWNMDRLTQQGATFYSAPGLVPGLLGAMLILLGSLLGVRALRNGAVAQLTGRWKLTADGRDTAMRVFIALALMLGYAIGLITRMPFWLATFLFVFVFILLFTDRSRVERARGWKGVLVSFVIAASTSAIIDLVFEDVFLVRLP